MGVVGMAVGLVCGVPFDLASLRPLEPVLGGISKHMSDSGTDQVIREYCRTMSAGPSRIQYSWTCLYITSQNSNISCDDGIHINGSVEVMHVWHDCLHHGERIWGQMLSCWCIGLIRFNNTAGDFSFATSASERRVAASAALGLCTQNPSSQTHTLLSLGPRCRARAMEKLFHFQDYGFHAGLLEMSRGRPYIGHAGLQGHIHIVLIKFRAEE